MENAFLKPAPEPKKNVSFSDQPKSATPTAVIDDYEKKLDSDFDIFRYKVLCLLVCRGDVKTKAGYLFDLVDNGSKLNYVPGKGKAESSVIWSSKRLKNAIKAMIMFSELAPRLYFHRLKADFPDDFDEKM